MRLYEGWVIDVMVAFLLCLSFVVVLGGGGGCVIVVAALCCRKVALRTVICIRTKGKMALYLAALLQGNQLS